MEKEEQVLVLRTNAELVLKKHLILKLKDGKSSSGDRLPATLDAMEELVSTHTTGMSQLELANQHYNTLREIYFAEPSPAGDSFLSYYREKYPEYFKVLNNS